MKDVSRNTGHRGEGSTANGFVGRGQELLDLGEALELSRLVTITGPPGSGKSRLAWEFWRNSQKDYDESHLVELAGAKSSDDAWQQIAAAIGMSVEAGPGAEGGSVGQILSAVESRGRCLVILDNFDRLAQQPSLFIDPWRERCPEATLLVTSRQALRTRDERRLELQPLNTEEAVLLYILRAKEIRAALARTPEVDGILSELVTRLDGLPLAIELAASRISTVSPAEFLQRMDERFRLLRSRNHGQSNRTMTLKEAIGLSWEMLSDSERQTLSQLAVFSGGFDLRAAEGVVQLDGEDQWVIDVVEDLREKSLLTVARDYDETRGYRFVFYETVRAYVLEQVPLTEAVRRRHAQYFADYWTRQMPRLNGPRGSEWLQQLRRDRKNLEDAWSFAREESDGAALQLALTLDALYSLVGPPEVHRRLLDAALEVADKADPLWQARILSRRAEALWAAGDLQAAAADLKEALARCPEDGANRRWWSIRHAELLRVTGAPNAAIEALSDLLANQQDSELKRLALGYQAGCWVDVGENERARDCVERLQTFSEGKDLRREYRLLRRLAYVHFYLGNPGEQKRLNEQTLKIAQLMGDERMIGLSWQGSGDVAYATGELEEAIASYEEALQTHRRMGNRSFEAILLGNLGAAHHRLEQFPQARQHYRQALRYHRAVGSRPYEGVVLFGLAVLEFESGRDTRARHHLEQARQLAEELGNPSDRAGLTLCLSWLDLWQMQPCPALTKAEQARELFTAGDLDEGRWAGLSEATMALARCLLGEDGRELLKGARGRISPGKVDCPAAGVAILSALCERFGARSSDEPSREVLAQLRQRFRAPDHPRSVLDSSLHARMLVRLFLHSEFSSVSAKDPAQEVRPDLELGADCQWFECPGQERVDLRRRKSLRLILEHLVKLHGGEPTGSDVYELFDVGWPGQEIAPEQAARRVYWAIRTLRQSGLGDAIVTTEDGYILAPELVIRKHDRQFVSEK